MSDVIIYIDTAAPDVVVEVESTPSDVEVSVLQGSFQPTTLFNDYGFIDNSDEWNEAYSWGDHALAGYLTDITGENLSDLSDVPAEPTGGTDLYLLQYDDNTDTLTWELASSLGGGANELSDLTDVNTSTPTNRNVLVADGVDWESRALTEADISDLQSYLTTVDLGYTTGSRTITNTGGTDAVIPLFNAVGAGLVPQSSGNSSEILFGDGVWRTTTLYTDWDFNTDTAGPVSVGSGVELTFAGGTGITVSSSGFGNRTLDFDLDNTTVTPSTYGAEDTVPIFTVDQQGRLTSATELAISITESQISDLQAYLTDAPSDGNEYVRLDGAWSIVSGGGTPAGSNTELQFNNGGAFGASSELTWDGTYLSAATSSGEVKIGAIDLAGNDYAAIWLSDINGTITPSVVNYALMRDNNNLRFNVNTGDGFEWRVNNSVQMSLDNLGNLSATSFITDTGTSSDFVKGDGSLDSNTYLTSADLTGYVDTTGTPANNQVAVFTDADTVEGTDGLTYDGTQLATQGPVQLGGRIVFDESFGIGGDRNIIIGDADTGSTLSTGSNNIFIGADAGENLEANNNVAIGYLAMEGATSSANSTVVGTNAMRYSSAAANNNTAIGYAALEGDNTDNLLNASANVAVGYDALELGGSVATSNNVVIGFQALDTKGTTFDGNIVLGSGALGSATLATDSIAIGRNVADDVPSIDASVVIGEDAIGFIDGAVSDSVIFGKEAGRRNSANDTNVTGTVTDCILIGENARLANGTVSNTNQITIGKGATSEGDNTTKIGNTNITDTYIEGLVHADDGIEVIDNEILVRQTTNGESTGPLIIESSGGTYEHRIGASSNGFDMSIRPSAGSLNIELAADTRGLIINNRNTGNVKWQFGGRNTENNIESSSTYNAISSIYAGVNSALGFLSVGSAGSLNAIRRHVASSNELGIEFYYNPASSETIGMILRGDDGVLDVTNNIEAPAFVTDGGTSGDFVKGDGSLDSSTYLTTVDEIQGVAIDSSVSTPSDGDILVYRSAGSDWVLETKPTGGGGSIQLTDLTDVNTSTPTNRNVLVADGVDWESRALVEADISDLQSYLTAEVNDLSASVTWVNVPDANITQSSVTQHQAALSITESQISDLDTYSTDIHANIAALDLVSGTNTGDQTSIVGITGTKAQFDTAVTDGDFMYIGDAPTAHTHTASEITDFDTEVSNNASVTANTAKVTFPGFTSLTADYGVTLATVATSGDYDDLSNKPTIPTTPTLSKSITIADPAADDDATIFYTPVAITVTDVASHIEGTTNVVFNIQHASTRTGTGLDVFTTDITLTSTAGQVNNSGFNDATIPAGSWVWLEITSVSGTPDLFHATVIYTED